MLRNEQDVLKVKNKGEKGRQIVEKLMNAVRKPLEVRGEQIAMM